MTWRGPARRGAGRPAGATGAVGGTNAAPRPPAGRAPAARTRAALAGERRQLAAIAREPRAGRRQPGGREEAAAQDGEGTDEHLGAGLLEERAELAPLGQDRNGAEALRVQSARDREQLLVGSVEPRGGVQEEDRAGGQAGASTRFFRSSRTPCMTCPLSMSATRPGNQTPGSIRSA